MMRANPVWNLELSSVLIGLVVGVLLTVALSYPRVGRALGKTLAVVLMALGLGLLTWGTLAMTVADSFQSMRFGPVVLLNPGQTVGWGAGCLAGGIVAIIMAFAGRNRPR